MVQSLRIASLRALLVGALLSVGSAALLAQRPPAGEMENPFPKMPVGFNGIFQHRDQRATDVLQYMQCMNTTVAAEQQGILGNVPDNAVLVCLREKNEWRGVFGVMRNDSTGFVVQAQFALRGNGVRTTDRVDTLRAGAIARALLRGLNTPVRGAPRNAFTPVPLHYDAYMEIWFVPVQNSATQLFVGGDSLIQLTVDGRREHGHFAKSPPVRGLPIPRGLTYLIQSNEDEIPLISELMVARMALTRVPEVRIRTKKYESVLSAKTPRWVHTPRPA
jgi:hypothetical protein